MIFFVAYAALTWYLAYRWRRHILGLVVLVASLGGLVLLGYIHWQFNQWSGGKLFLPVLQALLYPFGGLVALMGGFMYLMPRTYAGRRCQRCGYDVTGLAEEGRWLCPECARPHAFELLGDHPCHMCSAPLMRMKRTPDRYCARCETIYLAEPAQRGMAPTPYSPAHGAIEKADQQHGEGEHGDDQKADQGHATLAEILDQRQRARERALGDQGILPGEPEHRGLE